MAYHITVKGATKGWADSGIPEVNKGDIVRIIASGEIKFASRVPFSDGYPRNPDGKDRQGKIEYPAGNYGADHPAPDRVKNSLVARIAGKVYQAGSCVEIESPGKGAIEFSNNDNDTGDNTGCWEVEVTVTAVVPRGSLHHEVLVVTQPSIWSNVQVRYEELLREFPRFVSEHTKNRLILHISRLNNPQAVDPAEIYDFQDPQVTRVAYFSRNFYDFLCRQGQGFDIADKAGFRFHLVIRQYEEPAGVFNQAYANTWARFNHSPFTMGEAPRRPSYIGATQRIFGLGNLQDMLGCYVHELCHTLEERFKEKGITMVSSHARGKVPHPFFHTSTDLEFYGRILEKYLDNGQIRDLPYHLLDGWCGTWKE